MITTTATTEDGEDIEDIGTEEDGVTMIVVRISVIIKT
jgi:hypothetical protein